LLIVDRRIIGTFEEIAESPFATGLESLGEGVAGIRGNSAVLGTPA
jgi:hypothetical protein